MSAVAAVLEPVLGLLGPALKTFLKTALLMVVAGIGGATIAAFGVAQSSMAAGAKVGFGIAAVALIVLAWAVVGVKVAGLRAAARAVEEAVRRFGLARKLGEATVDRMEGLARLSRGGAAEGRAAAVAGTAVATVEDVPLARAEGYLRSAIDSLLGEGLPGGGLKGWLLRRVRAVVLGKVGTVMLSSFRKEAKEGGGAGGGIDIRKVAGAVATRIDDLAVDLVKGQVRKVAIAGGILLAVVTLLPILFALTR